MSVFSFEEAETETQPDQEGDEGESEVDADVKSVTVLESSNGSGYSTQRVTIPAKFADDMDLEGGDVLLMRHEEGSDTIEVTVP